MTSRLKDYSAKRDFRKTPEPGSGEGSENAKIAASEHLRFVIQKHYARRLHYDLRLELGGTFRSWAVTKGPSLDPGEKRLAVEVEDHPLAYGDFEGTIPEGEYGAGTVMIWDRGFWQPEGKTRPADALENGELKFVLAGGKLQGGFVLVRMKPKEGETRNNWLLIKHRDPWATPGTDAVLKQDRSAASGRTMAQIRKGSGSEPKPFMVAHNDDCKERKGSGRVAAPGSEAKAPEMPKLSSPGRILWPDCGYTKTDLAGYLVDVAAWMLPHVAGRPCALVRAPDGIGEDTFFQRHPMAGPTAKAGRLKLDDDHDPYIVIEDAATLVSFAQVSAIEFHPGNAAPGMPETPGRLVFDLDPGPDVDFDDVVDAAKAVKAELEEAGLVAYCKTTGGKGLHVVTPLRADPDVDWAQAKLFAETICARIAERSPQRFTTNMKKSERKGRIFLDYLRNDRLATAVAPLSPRARPGALVSMPLNWTQVRKGLDPTRFDIKSAPRLLSESAAWNDYAANARPLKAAILALVGEQK